MINILFDITHPAYVHLFKNIIRELKTQGHFVSITTRDSKDIIELLKIYNIPFQTLGDKGRNIIEKIVNQQYFNIKLHQIINKQKIDLVVGGSTTVAQGALFTQAKSMVFTDDDGDIVPLFAKSTYPFVNKIVHPKCIRDRLNPRKQILVDTYKELAYLHPNNFVPEKTIFNLLNLKEDEKYFVVRFSALKAHHDTYAKGIQEKYSLIKYLDNYGRVFISSESALPNILSKYQLSLPANLIHSLLYYATLYVGDSQTMAAESAVLGTPSIRCNSFVGKLSYLEELEKKYQLTIGITPENFVEIFDLIDRFISNPTLKDLWEERREVLLKDKIDLSEWFVNYINTMEWQK